MSNSSAFKLAIIGAGGISNAHSAGIKANASRLALTAAIDPNAQNAQKLAGDHSARTFETADQFLAARAKGEVQADGVIVCTPPSMRVQIIENCLKAGLHVLAEKPIAHTLSDAKRLVQIAAAYPKLVTAVAYCHRFTPAIVQMKALVASGKIGRLTRFENCFATYFPALRERWMSDPAVSGGGSFIDTGCHSLDLFYFLVGVPKMQACVRETVWDGRGESSATAVVRSAPAGSLYPNVGGVILSGWMEPDRFTVDLIGTEGTLSYDYLKATELVFKSVRTAPEVLPIESHDVRFAKQLLGFADAATTGAKAALATFADGFVTAEAVDAAYRL